MFCGWKSHRFDRPAHVGRRDELAFRVFPGAAQAVDETFGEYAAILFCAVVVFAGPDVAARAVEMDMQGGRHRQLPIKARDAEEIRVGDAGAIITLRVRGIITQDRDRLIAVPKTDERDYWVDNSFERRANLR